jgi:hypothetical protein
MSGECEHIGHTKGRGLAPERDPDPLRVEGHRRPRRVLGASTKRTLKVLRSLKTAEAP